MSDSVFGVSARALQLCEDRANLLTSNIVNSSTPNYKARDLDFYKLVREAQAQNNNTLIRDNPNQLTVSNVLTNEPTQYRIPNQDSLDGNTVDSNIERKNFLENAMRYQVSLTFLQYKSEELTKAIKGD